MIPPPQKIRHISKARFVPLLMFLMTGFYPGLTQKITDIPDHEASYFIDLNINTNTIHQLPDNVWSIKYFDAINTLDFLPVTIYDWKRQEVGHYKLSKSYGLNYYNIEIDFLKVEQVYFAEAIDEAGVTHHTAFSLKGPPTEDKPNAEIIVNPMNLSCESFTDNLIEFYVILSGGRTPYQVQWFVLNEQMSDFLYLPRLEKIDGPGKGMSVTVDATPAYHVMAQIEDACGNKLNKVVSVNCQKEEKVYHSIFIEPLSKTMGAVNKQ
ncbi:hypothetical protein FNH22_11405 [Fulvivirga sp. M361]|uniref:hypothetical protein n=1 Tax=Fulvivirga sp. M361 TaxID=2594266 RepID=UPI00117BCA22|nr:hypothetical protein [Fulvivirga sp. M361]TRX59123.1 hypothetical protein FNH22_11405 [Fulvivirga sp. M361]